MGKSSKKSKKHSKKRESSSSEEEWVEAETIKKRTASSDSSEDDLIQSKNSSRHRSSSSAGSSKSVDRTERKKKNLKRKHSHDKTNKNQDFPEQRPRNTEIVRDDWMNLPTNFSSFSNVDKKKEREEERKNQKERDVYDPSKCPRELNVYWKNGGDGLPKFHKPSDDSYSYKSSNNRPSNSGQSRWRKSKPENEDGRAIEPRQSLPNESAVSHSNNDSITDATATDKPITEKELNLLAGKLVKAEIMGNRKLIEELKEKLENGRKALAEDRGHDEEVLLTQANRQGASKPLELQSRAEGSGKQRKKAIETHVGNERVKYFPDDDKYSLKQMFENEKFSSVNDQDAEFLKMVSNVKKNDDLDDLFTDDVRRKKSDSKVADAKRSKAINEHQKVSSSLDNCVRCIQSTAMQKHLIVSMGEFVYLALPGYEPLVEGHCLIIPIRHAVSITQLDENEWSEMNDFRKALIRMYAAKQKELLFFEIAVGFHRYPHMALECIPLGKEDASMAPMYFKKAIDESETEWAQNKKLVSLKGRDVRRAIPKELPYFAINFGTSEGFAHVIEDDKLFPKNFAQEIIGGMLDLDHSTWRKPSRESFEAQSKRTLSFSNEWKDFDCSA